MAGGEGEGRRWSRAGVFPCAVLGSCRHARCCTATGAAAAVRCQGRRHSCRGAEALPMVQTFQHTTEILQLLFDKVIDVPVVRVVQVVDTLVVTQRLILMVQTVQKSIEIPQLLVDKVVDVPVVWEVQVSQVPSWRRQCSHSCSS